MSELKVLEVTATYQTHEAKLTQKENPNLRIKVLPYNRMPEMYTKDGHQIMLAYTIQATKTDGGILLQPTQKSTFKLIKLPKGSVVNYDGSVSTPNDINGPTLRVKVNDGKNVEFLQIMTLNSDPPVAERDPVGDIGEVAKTILISEILPKRISDVSSGFFDLYDATKVYMDGKMINPNSLIAMANTSFALLVILGDMIATDKMNEMSAEYNSYTKNEIEKAKKISLEEVEKRAKRSQNGNLKYGQKVPLNGGAVEYRVMDVTESTIKKLLAGEFKTFDDLFNFNYNQYGENPDISLLYKVIGDGASPDDLYIVETIFY